MKLKITLWIDDEKLFILDDDIKDDITQWIINEAFVDPDVKIKQVQIEETEFED